MIKYVKLIWTDERFCFMKFCYGLWHFCLDIIYEVSSPLTTLNFFFFHKPFLALTPSAWFILRCTYYYCYLTLWREKAPGQRECDDAIEVLNSCIREVDQASLAAISQQLTPREDVSMEVNAHTDMHVRTHTPTCMHGHMHLKMYKCTRHGCLVAGSYK